MTPAQYHLYAALFDAALAIDQADDRASGREFGSALGLQLHGAVAGASLRSWAAARGVEATPETRELTDHGERRTWTRIAVNSRLYGIALIVVHLDDAITTPLVAEAA